MEAATKIKPSLRKNYYIFCLQLVSLLKDVLLYRSDKNAIAVIVSSSNIFIGCILINQKIKM